MEGIAFRDVCFVGLGARTAVGLTALPACAAVRAGISRIREHPHMRDKAGEAFMVAMVPGVEGTTRAARMTQLVRPAIEQVLQVVRTLGAPQEVTQLTVALPETSASFGSADAALLRNDVARAFAPTRVDTLIGGNAAGLLALQAAATRIERGQSHLEIVAGVDSFMDANLLELLDDNGRIASPSNRWGFPPGEGAGAIAVASSRAIRGARLPSLGRLRSIAVAKELHTMDSTGNCLGEGLGAVFRDAGRAAGVPVTGQYCDIDGDRYREHEFSYAILRAPQDVFVNATDYVAPADCWGHCGAATAVLLTMLPIAWKSRRAPIGDHPMIWCGSDSGSRAAAILDLSAGA